MRGNRASRLKKRESGRFTRQALKLVVVGAGGLIRDVDLFDAAVSRGRDDCALVVGIAFPRDDVPFTHVDGRALVDPIQATITTITIVTNIAIVAVVL